MTDRYEAPNFDLLLKACQTTAKALFPNFMFLDAPFNQNEKWRADDPETLHLRIGDDGLSHPCL